MKNIVAFAGSNSKKSINKILAGYTASLVNNTSCTLLDLNDFELPMYGMDAEVEFGVPKNAQNFLDIIQSSDGIIVSLAEYNGSYSSVFKNLFDWMSRIDKNVWANKPMFLMSTSPGGRGGVTVLEAAKNSFPHLGGNIITTYSLPSFYDNFKENKIVDKELLETLEKAVSIFENNL